MPYLTQDGDFYKCWLCNTGNMHRNNIQSHLSGWSHRYELEKINFGERVQKVTRDMSHRINKLGSIVWRNDMKAYLFDYVSNSNMNTSTQEEAAVDIAKKKLEKYEKMERTSLLELAVWKASCLHFDGSQQFLTMQDILDRWALDESFDPAGYKSERRFTSGVAVVMRHVVEFVD